MSVGAFSITSLAQVKKEKAIKAQPINIFDKLLIYGETKVHQQLFECDHSVSLNTVS